MWEMFLIVFIRQELLPDLHSVYKTSIAKGMGSVIGNKGCLAYQFTLRDRVFSIINNHLIHGQVKDLERNQMSS